jgi:hypothetical protein
LHIGQEWAGQHTLIYTPEQDNVVVKNLCALYIFEENTDIIGRAC